ncbi:hypothetical protein BH23ACT5_BH23ACT5_20450 [soil metagenome]
MLQGRGRSQRRRRSSKHRRTETGNSPPPPPGELRAGERRPAPVRRQHHPRRPLHRPDVTAPPWPIEYRRRSALRTQTPPTLPVGRSAPRPSLVGLRSALVSAHGSSRHCVDSTRSRRMARILRNPLRRRGIGRGQRPPFSVSRLTRMQPRARATSTRHSSIARPTPLLLATTAVRIDLSSAWSSSSCFRASTPRSSPSSRILNRVVPMLRLKDRATLRDYRRRSGPLPLPARGHRREGRRRPDPTRRSSPTRPPSP